MRPRIFKKVGELPWYHCSPDCRSPTWWVWDLILLCLRSPYHLVVASSLSLDMEYLFFFLIDGFQHPPVDCCSTASCDFVPLQEMSACPSTPPS